MRHTGRSTRIHAGGKGAVQSQVVDASLKDPDLLPEVMLLHPHRAGVGARRELQHTSIIARLRVAAQDLLRQASDPAHGAIGKGHRIEELEFRFCHGLPPSSTGPSGQPATVSKAFNASEPESENSSSSLPTAPSPAMRR